MATAYNEDTGPRFWVNDDGPKNPAPALLPFALVDEEAGGEVGYFPTWESAQQIAYLLNAATSDEDSAERAERIRQERKFSPPEIER